MAEQKHTQVGLTFDDYQERDAIHIAVACVKASERVSPGQHVKMVEGSNIEVYPCSIVDSPTGIVDPYLDDSVDAGIWFWVFLNPYTITSLNHSWSHPHFTFSESPNRESVAELDKKNKTKESWEWLNDFGNRYNFSGERMVAAGIDYLENSEYFSDGMTFDGETVPEEFWDHFEVVTGRQVLVSDRDSFFTCAC